MTDNAVTRFSEHRAQLGEGPTYDPATRTAFWFDIEGKALFEKRDGAAEAVRHALPFMASALCVVDAARQLIAAEDGLYLRDTASGALSLHLPLEADDPQTRSNDGRTHPSGALWIGTMHKGGEAGRGAIYWYRMGEIRQLYPRIGIPNAICFTADGRLAYFTDTKVGRLMKVDCDPQTGLPTGEPRLFLDHSGGEGGLDGSVCDAEGTVWNARWGAGTLDAYAPDGTRLRSIALGARQVTCPAFVGPKADRIIVTSAYSGLSEAERAADPDAGATFLVDSPVCGRHDPAVAV
ncbi:SMP-30/gluconolactonase/LRE family protein [Aurantimonas sp. Leaf443]|uniref:SMP-30/gluconolactonase/LRE family protein n=1 Tax=Aurantimonas sp. Leaf443 TaxID=1736378 RepID=UPI000701FD38|nr:SMP-30/gluconolactonase/LRE family protein [Aurantimonas sp. Leaf443]KQT82178.1 gluconolaconase [Aurantimonas sp. Leaf443]